MKPRQEKDIAFPKWLAYLLYVIYNLILCISLALKIQMLHLYKKRKTLRGLR